MFEGFRKLPVISKRLRVVAFKRKLYFSLLALLVVGISSVAIYNANFKAIPPADLSKGVVVAIKKDLKEKVHETIEKEEDSVNKAPTD